MRTCSVVQYVEHDPSPVPLRANIVLFFVSITIKSNFPLPSKSLVATSLGQTSLPIGRVIISSKDPFSDSRKILMLSVPAFPMTTSFRLSLLKSSTVTEERPEPCPIHTRVRVCVRRYFSMDVCLSSSDPSIPI